MLEKRSRYLKKKKKGAAPIIDAAWGGKNQKSSSFLPGQYKHECLLIVTTAQRYSCSQEKQRTEFGQCCDWKPLAFHFWKECKVFIKNVTVSRHTQYTQVLIEGSICIYDPIISSDACWFAWAFGSHRHPQTVPLSIPTGQASTSPARTTSTGTASVKTLSVPTS